MITIGMKEQSHEWWNLPVTSVCSIVLVQHIFILCYYYESVVEIV